MPHPAMEGRPVAGISLPRPGSHLLVPPDIVADGASAGGIQSLTYLLRRLPPDFGAAIFVVVHLGARPSHLVEILERTVEIPVGWAIDGEPITEGEVRIGPPDRHLLVLPKSVGLG